MVKKTVLYYYFCIINFHLAAFNIVQAGSQCSQDQWVLSTFDGQYGRFFVDLAANDWDYLSNTYLLEQNGWDGICIEIVPYYVERLRASRKCKVAEYAITSVPQEIEFEVHGAVSSIVAPFAKLKPGSPKSDIYRMKVNTTTLLSVLIHYDAPSVIDYLSLDIEGAEYEAMRLFPFHHYTFLTASVENPGQCLFFLLIHHGYIPLKTTCRSKAMTTGETLFVHKTHPNVKPLVEKTAGDRHRADDGSRVGGVIWETMWTKGEMHKCITLPSGDGVTNEHWSNAVHIDPAYLVTDRLIRIPVEKFSNG